MSQNPYNKDPRYSYKLSDTGEINRIEGEQVLHVANLDLKTGVVTFNKANLRRYKKEVLTWLAEDEIKYKSIQREDLPADSASPGIPKKPKADKNLGDKTPAVVEWYRKYKPNEFVTRYGIFDQTYTGPVKEIVNNYVTNINGQQEFRGTTTVTSNVVDALVAERKIDGVTYTQEECVNWEAQYGGEDDEE